MSYKIEDYTFLNFEKKESTLLGIKGCLLKSNFTKDGISYYVKLSTQYSSNHFGIDNIHEIIAYRVGTRLGLNMLPYKLNKVKVKLENKTVVTYAVVSKEFKKAGETKITARTFYEMNHKKGEDELNFFLRTFPKFTLEMFIFDYIIGNKDRHEANIELLANKKNEIRLAPLFDNGINLMLPLSENEQWKSGMINERANNYIGSRYLNENVKLALGKMKLRKLNDNDKRGIFYNLLEPLTEHFENEEDARLYIDLSWKLIKERWDNVRCKNV